MCKSCQFCRCQVKVISMGVCATKSWFRQTFVANLLCSRKALTSKNESLCNYYSEITTFLFRNYETKTKLQKLIKGVHNCCKLQVNFKSQKESCNIFCFKDTVPHILSRVWFVMFNGNHAMNPVMENAVRHLAVRSGKHTGCFTFNQLKCVT